MKSKETIASFRLIMLRVSRMRCTEEFEIISRENAAELCRYTLHYAGGDDDRRLERSVTLTCGDVLDLLNRCDVPKWDGFVGKNPPHVLDGVMFSFRAEVNDGRVITAHGSNHFPKHYHEFCRKLDEWLL